MYYTKISRFTVYVYIFRERERERLTIAGGLSLGELFFAFLHSKALDNLEIVHFTSTIVLEEYNIGLVFGDTLEGEREGRGGRRRRRRRGSRREEGGARKSYPT